MYYVVNLTDGELETYTSKTEAKKALDAIIDDALEYNDWDSDELQDRYFVIAGDLLEYHIERKVVFNG